MTQIVLPYNIVNGTPEDISQVMADFNAIVQVVNGLLDSGNIADDAISASKLAANAVTTAKILDSAVSTGKIADLAVTDIKLATDSVTAAKIAALAVGTGELADSAVTSAKIADGTIAGGDVGAGVLTDVHVSAANKDGASGSPSLRTLGTGAAQACAGNDARLSDARTPTAHTHPWNSSTGFKVVSLARTGGVVSLTNGAWTAIPWDTEVSDADGLHAPGASAVSLSGASWWLVTAQCGFAASAVNSRGLRILVDGSLRQGEVFIAATNSGQHTHLTVASIVNGSSIEVQAWQNSGGALTTCDTDGATFQPRLQAVAIAP